MDYSFLSSQLVKAYNFKTRKYEIIVSGVQTGKTAEMLAYCWRAIYSNYGSVIFIVRNVKADEKQLLERIYQFNDKMKKLEKLEETFGNLKLRSIQVASSTDAELKEAIRKGRYIITALCNASQIGKLNNIIDESHRFNICIDELDFSIKSSELRNLLPSALEVPLRELKKKASHMIGATATPFAVYSSDREFDKVHILSPTSNYKGIESIHHHSIIDNNDTAHFKVYRDFLERSYGDERPGIILDVCSKKKVHHHNLRTQLSKWYSKLCVISYNGDGIIVSLPKERRSVVPSFSEIMKESFLEFTVKDDEYIFENASICEVLQCLKDDLNYTYTHISIISGHLASRGISFVSSDYKWHLTDQILLPSRKPHGEGLLQSMRIFGKYNDDQKLRLFCSNKTWSYIKNQYKILEKLTTSLNNISGKDEIKEKLKLVKFEKPKIALTREKVKTGKIKPSSEKDEKVVRNEQFFIVKFYITH